MDPPPVVPRGARDLRPGQYAALVAALGGPDHGGTRLWWDRGVNF